MGMADIVPGVSGGTIALITGIYERLLSAIVAADAEAVALLLTRTLASTVVPTRRGVSRGAAVRHPDGYFFHGLRDPLAAEPLSAATLGIFFRTDFDQRRATAP